jgi:sulfite reductase (NADPH) flavoprotein alpha-component
MSAPAFIPQLPESAPFTPEQRAYLNGFFAGLFLRVPAPANAAPVPAGKPLEPLTILFGSQTGNAENLARRAAREAGRRGFAATIYELAKYPTAQLASEGIVLVITSTYGDGEPPDNAKSFWEFLGSDAVPTLTRLRFSVCALGDTNYPKFCAFGKAVDERLEKLGGTRAHPRTDCDVDFESPFQQWLSGALTALNASASKPEDGAFSLTPALSLGGRENDSPLSGESKRGDGTTSAGAVSEHPSLFPLPKGEGRGEGEVSTQFSRANPFPAPLITNRRLNGAGSAKDTRHFEFALEGSGLNYEAGDALGVFPANCGELAEEIVRALGHSGEEAVPGARDGEVSLREALVCHYDITRINQPLLVALAAKTGDDLLKQLTVPGVNGELTKFLWGREVIDLLLAHPEAKFNPAEFVGLLKKLQPRLYSISSSPKAHAGQVHLCVGVVRYESLGRARKGVCSTFLAERVPANSPAPVFIHANKNFRPPPGGDTPMIMVGPGTGVAPFHAFLEDRRVTGAKGRNWLFFGDQRGATDFLYRDELEALHRDGLLTRLDTAFSRDQAEKVYVQQRMLENAKELFSWLEAGAHFYVCGDASRMAKDVDAALHQLVQSAGGKTVDQAAEYVRRLQSEKRYQRDVY